MKQRFFLGLFFLLFIYSCSRIRDSNYLSKAEECFHTFPDSSRYYLDMIDFPEKMSDADHASWILLNVGLHQKNNSSLENDTLILKALDYYIEQNMVAQIGRANLYAGRVFEAREDRELAKKYFNEAILIGERSNNYKWAGRSASEVAEMYRDDKDYERAIAWFTKSYNWATEAEDGYYRIAALRKRADCHLEKLQFEKALQDYDKALVEIPIDKQELCGDIYKNRAIAHLKKGAFAPAKADINSAMKYGENAKLKAIHLWILAGIFEAENQFDSAYFYNNKAFLEVKSIRNTDRDSPNSLQAVLDMNASDDRQASNLQTYQLYRSVSDSVYEKERFKDSVSLGNKFHQELFKNKTKTLVIRNQQYLLLLAMTVLVLLIVFFLYRIKTLKTKAMLAERDRAIGHRDQTIDTYKISASKRLDIYRRMIRLSLVPNSGRYAKLLDDYSHIVYGSTQPFRFEWKDFEELIHLVYPEFKEKLNRQFLELRPREVQIILLQKGGLSIQEIADLLGLSIHTIYRGNSEIRKKMYIPENQSILFFLSKNLH